MVAMKEIQATSKIGAGLFTDDTLELQFNFEGGEKLQVEVLAITQDMVADFHREGVKFADYKNELEALEHSTKVFNHIAVGATYIDFDGKVHELEGKYKDRVMQLPDVMAAIFDEARKHAAELEDTDAGNSES
jgi:hypothetical protein